MKVKIKKNEGNPYIMDYVADKNGIPALTRKNASFIEAVIMLDSNYAQESKKLAPDEGFDPEKHVLNAQGKYCGSVQYWFDEIKSEEMDFATAVLGAVISLDRANSTHLETSKDGRRTMRERICETCKNYDGLKKVVGKKFTVEDRNHLMAILSSPIESRKGGMNYHVSFASKFCSSASINLGCGDNYSKYDKVVSEALPSYAQIYLGEECTKSRFKMNYNVQKNMTDRQRLLYRLGVYQDYCNTIEKIIQTLKEDNGNIIISREELDHIIWYGFKGE